MHASIWLPCGDAATSQAIRPQLELIYAGERKRRGEEGDLGIKGFFKETPVREIRLTLPTASSCVFVSSSISRSQTS